MKFILFLFIAPVVTSDSVRFYLTNPNVNSLLYNAKNQSPWLAAFDSDCTTVFLVHGWMGIIYPLLNEPLQSTVDAYQQVPTSSGCYNVVLVIWSAANTPDYLSAAKAVVPTGNTIGDFISNLYQESVLTGRVDCTGHSLGAHACGNAGRRLNTLALTPFEVITGLDAAGPAFTSVLVPLNMSSKKLAKGNARIVVTLMTNAGLAGTAVQLGDVNFKANGGSCQPGCAPLNLVCSHMRAVALYEEAVLHDWFVGESACGETAVFGRSMSLNVVPGSYGFTTGSNPPYGQCNQ